MFCAGAQNSWSGAAPPIPAARGASHPDENGGPNIATIPIVLCGGAARESQGASAARAGRRHGGARLLAGCSERRRMPERQEPAVPRDL
jgi:hypothetical protein